MRRFMIAILLASALATPAIADPVKNSASGSARHGPSQHSSHSSAPTRSAPPRIDRSPRAQVLARPSGSATVKVRNPAADERIAASRNDRARIQTTAPAVMRGPEIVQPPGRVLKAEKRPPNVVPQLPVVSRTPRPGTQPPPRIEPRGTPKPQWNRDWRNKDRYNWHKWRNHHRSRFHLNLYIDPFGWGYSRYGIGWRLWPVYYASSYWIDSNYYDLPPAPPGMRWVRYYNDALLVDMWTGEVVDVIHDFFW